MNSGCSKSLWKTGLCAALLFATLLLVPFLGWAQEIDNPIKSRSFEDLIMSVANAIRKIALVLAGLAILLAGFRFITAGLAGDPKGIAEARKMFFWILIGTAITVGATLLAEVVVNT